MSLKKLIKIAAPVLCVLFCAATFAQESGQTGTIKLKNELRGKNAVTTAGGTSVMNGDFVDPLWEIYFHGGYKRFLGSHVNINFVYHKFNLAYKDQFNNGYMSFDLSLETLFTPFNNFSPYIYAGGGLNAANYFERTDMKIHGGGGLEMLFTDQIGVKLFADYNHVFSDMIDGLEAGAAEDVYWRIGAGLNFYFGRKLKSQKTVDIPTIINSNQLADDY